MPDSAVTSNNTLSNGKSLSDAFPEDLKSMNYWGFCITAWGKDEKGNDTLDKIPFHSYVKDGKLTAYKCAPANFLKTFAELGELPDLMSVAASLGIERPNAIYYRFSLGGNILGKDKKTIEKTIPAPKIVILDYDKVVDDSGNFTDEKIKEEIQNLKQEGYVELSASGHGFHAVSLKPSDWNIKGVIKADGMPEVFSGDKFVCMTGNVVSRTNSLIANKKLLIDITERQVQKQPVKEENPFVPASVIATTNGQYQFSEAEEKKKAVRIMETGDLCGFRSPSDAALSVIDYLVWKVKSKDGTPEAVRELDVMFRSTPFFQIRYPNGDGWHSKKADLTYTKAFQAKKELLALNGGNTFTISANTACRPDSFLDSAVEVDVLPESTYAKQKLRMDLSVYPADHLVMKYVNYIRERTNTYPEYSYLGIMFIVSVLTCSKAVFSTGFTMRKEMCNVWATILGMSSISRKSTSFDNTEDLLKDVLRTLARTLESVKNDAHYPQPLSSPGSREGFAQELDEHEVRYYMQDEAGGFINRLHSQNMSALEDDLCYIYDNKGFKIRLSRNRKKNDEPYEYGAENPFLSMFLATTPDAFKQSATRLDITSGFFMRFLFASPEYQKDNYKSTLTDSQKGELYKEIFNKLLAILKFFVKQQGETLFDFSPEAKAMVEDWYEANEQKAFSEGGEKAEIKLSYNSRLGIYARKLAVLNFIMTPDCYEKEKLLVPAECMRQAIHMCDTYFMPCFLEVEDSIGRSKNNLQNDILSFLKEHNGQCSLYELQRHLRKSKKVYSPELDALIENQEVEVYKVTGDANKRGPKTTYFRLVA